MTKRKSKAAPHVTPTYVGVVLDVLDYLRLCRLDGTRADMVGYQITVTASDGRSTTIAVDP